MTAPSDDATTDLHGVIASLQAERDAALSGENRAGRGSWLSADWPART